jgi:glycosyltransferase involved in cell wall biosynthesis
MSTRVLHIVPNLVPYGIQRVVESLATLADRDRFDVSVVSLYADVPGTLAASIQAQGVPVFHLDKRHGLDLRMFSRVSKLIRELRPHIVHTHNYVLRYALPPAMRHRVPAIVHTIHNVADREVDRAGMWLQKRAFRRRVTPVAIAGEAAASFERVYGLARPRLIMNGIDVERYAAAAMTRDAWRKAEGFRPDDLLFACIARYFPQKNHKALIEAFAAGPARMPNAYLLLAGDGPLEAELEAEARSAGLAGRVRLLGRRDDIPELLAACDVFTLASLWEGNPLSVMEAMAAGRPVVVTAVGGMPELAESGKHGFVVPAGDVPALKSAMMRLAGEGITRRWMGLAAAAHARRNFDHRLMVRAYESLYGELVPNTRALGAACCAVR